MNLRRLAILLSLSSILLSSSLLMAGPPSFTTNDLFNGRMWQLLNGAQKLSHLTGIHEGIILCLNQIKEDLKISSDLMKSMRDSGIFDRTHVRLRLGPWIARRGPFGRLRSGRDRR